jgi:eukaryotic-like serine/threonine-protein kinase
MSITASDIRKIDEKAFIGRQLGSVVIERMIGRGNMGIVFAGTQRTLNRPVAVKVLPKSTIANDIARQQFRDEAEIIAILSHPNIIPIFEMGETDEFYFQVMQLVQGRDLRTIIREKVRSLEGPRTLPVRQSVDILAAVLDGLDVAHNEGIVHQDIKPANILMDERFMRPMIADFGIAKTAQIEYSTQGFVVGTPLYLSPEQAAGNPTDRRSDIYSAGVVLFEMVAGSLPVRAENVELFLARKLREPETIFLKKPSEASPEVTPEISDCILKATAADARSRFQDCRSFRESLLRSATSLNATRPAGTGE